MKKWLLLSLCCFITCISHSAPLPASEVFQLNAKAIDPNTFVVSWEIKPGHFLYSDRISVTQSNDAGLQVGTLRFPPTVTKTDKKGHAYTVYRNKISLPVSVLANKPGDSLVKLHYQGCSDEGFCYPPETKDVLLTVNDQLALTDAHVETSGLETKSTQPASDGQVAHLFSEHNWVVILLIFYGMGLLLAFTPCILPMIPVLSGIIVGHGASVTTRKAFFLSLSYVLSMSLTYAILGGVVALLGANLQISMQSPWVISVFSLIFVLLALSMFGFYEFKLPESWQQKISGSSRTQRGGHYVGAAIMGSLSTLILSPCVTAPLIAVLTYIAQTGNVFLGMITLFILSLGMGTPLLLIGTSAGKWLPEAGSWMDAIKAFFGILFIAIALYLLARILPTFITMALWGSLLVFSGIYAGALTRSITNTEKFYQGIGIILLVYGLLILIGGSMGATNPLQPLSELQASNRTVIESKAEYTLPQLKQVIADASGKPVMLDFYADWCASCKIMEETTFKDPKVQDALTHFQVIQVNVTASNATNKELMKYFNVVAPPAFIFFDTKGKELNDLRVVGEHSADEFLKLLNEAEQK